MSSCFAQLKQEDVIHKSETLSDLRRSILHAAIDRLMPPGIGPGALDAGVEGYIKELFENRFSVKARKRFEEGLDKLQSLARTHHGKNLSNCSSAEQDQVLSQAQQDSDLELRRFLKILITLTIEGFFSDPVHGGNRDQVGWQFIDYKPRRPQGNSR